MSEPTCPHQWEYRDETWHRCTRCGQHRRTLEGTITLHDPHDGASGFWINCLDPDEHFGRLLAPFIDRRVRITVETLDHA